MSDQTKPTSSSNSSSKKSKSSKKVSQKTSKKVTSQPSNAAHNKPADKSKGKNANAAATSPANHSKNSTNKSVMQESTPVQQTPPQQTVVNQQKSGGKGLSIFAILLSLAALGGTGYQFYASQLTGNASKDKVLVGVNEIGGNVKVLSERMNQMQRSQQSLEQNVVNKSELKASLLQANNETDLLVRDLKDQQKTLSAAVQKFTADNQRSGDKLALGEVSQLLKLANNSAVFSGDKLAALNALKLADSQLKELADPRYAVVRRQINAEISQLDAIESVDVASVSAQLNALADKIPSLPLENEPPVASEIKIAEPEAEQEVSFKSELKRLWTDTLNSIKIKRVDQPPKPLLAPEQRYFLDQNIQLKLNTAELALMQNKASVYKRNIESALSWLSDYYDPRSEDVKSVMAELGKLKQQSLAQELPSIAGSYDQLQRIKGGN